MLTLYSLQSNPTIDLSLSSGPVLVRAWHNSSLSLPEGGTHFGYVNQGCPQLSRQGHGTVPYPLHAGMYFCLPGLGIVLGEQSSGLVITHTSYHGLFHLGGPIEPTGRFAYIDGGTSSLLIPPVMLGDPCLHALYCPAGVDQTLHTHPSDRLGLVVAGRGILATPQTAFPIEPGLIFHIPAHLDHKFQTPDSPLTLVVFHPDSETGFTHRNHPMLQRTQVDGVSAVDLPQLQTRHGSAMATAIQTDSFVSQPGTNDADPL